MSQTVAHTLVDVLQKIGVKQILGPWVQSSPEEQKRGSKLLAVQERVLIAGIGPGGLVVLTQLIRLPLDL